jgi:hypothetical protein
VSIAWNDIVTGAVAAVAASGSLFTFVYQYALKSRLDAQIGQEIMVHYSAADKLILTGGFVFLNKGAMPTAMTGLFGTIWADGSTKPKDANLAWRQFEKIERVSALGDRADYRYGSSGTVETLVIPGRGASSSHTIRLYSNERISLESKTYMLALQAVDGSAKGSALTCRLFLSKDDAEELANNGTEAGGHIKSRISFKRTLTLAGTRKSRADQIRSVVPFKRKAERAAIIEFRSDGMWSANPNFGAAKRQMTRSSKR